MARFYLKDGTEVAGLREARKLGAVPSVTTIINGCTPHEYKFLDDQRLRRVLTSEEEIEDKLYELGNKPVFEAGHVVHEANEEYVKSGIKSDPLGCPKSTRELYAYMDGLEIVEMEKFYYSETLETGGKIDILSRSGFPYSLHDLKTCSTLKKKPEKSWLLQLGAYYLLLFDYRFPIKGAKILQFSKKNEGMVPLLISNTELQSAGEAFGIARELFRYYHGI